VTDSSGYAIVAQDVGIKYDLRLKRRRTLKQTVGQLLRGDTVSLGENEFWALQGVSFALERGEVLGVVGRNGSGKSTLLQVIAGVLRPDAGALTTYGLSPTLLTLGAGFVPELTGRENVYLNAAYLGFRREQIEARFEAIIEFAELGRFIEAPVTTYSSGMRSRLGFSIAVHLEPEILLLDEVLGVGDAGFQRKSRQKMNELMARAQALVVVSHSPRFITEVTTKVLWLEAGRIRAFGDPEEIMERYGEESRKPGRPAEAAA